MKKLDKTLIIGIGNNTRHDDGLGWAFLDMIEKEDCIADTDDLRYKYQLMVEDAEVVAEYDRVIFIDASKADLKSGFAIDRLEPAEQVAFSTHAVPPNQILNLCNSIYNKNPQAFVIQVAGNVWDIEIALSPFAQENLQKAFDAFKAEFLN